jgi:hypothetical protein
MTVIPVLALNDDNHSVCYVTRDGYWFDADSFMEEVLCKPHTVEFKIKYINLIYLNTTLEYKGMNVKEMFYRVDDFRIKYQDELTREDLEKREIAFNYLWNTEEDVLHVE